MVVMILSAAPAALRGALTRWLLEVDPGVYVGHLSARVRDQLWELVRSSIGSGRALLIYSNRSEQRFAIESFGHEKIPTDMDGCLVMTTPYERGETETTRLPGSVKAPKEAWSIAARRRRYRNSAERNLGRH
ncbi:CRISPR-associated endoribonuclease cas2, subtype I-e [Propionibacterium sp. oral taxon 192 str. F0372]|uniref:type I-E CRISPR-associated endoribonuclease Cas2e n=1 Tax=Propionibacterium sp. oral taxon 192 TaxID=671222 RepID=UPI000353C965|nr:CRISPR-associated endoribonuclease cas2, subtype I-e [Propionibacterium sp. oral taxon 192 str. F0372]